MTADLPADARRKRVRDAECRSLIRRHDHAMRAAEVALVRAREIVAELVLLAADGSEVGR